MLSGKELKQLRESLGLSVWRVAEMTRMSRPTIYAIENGKSSEKNYLYLELFYEHYRYEKMVSQK